jgi:hypothetical protein
MGIRLSLEVVEALKLPEQVVQGLLAGTQSRGELRWPHPLGSWVLEDVQVRRLDIGEAVLVQPLEHVPLHGLPGHAQERADQRRWRRRGRFRKIT